MITLAMCTVASFMLGPCLLIILTVKRKNIFRHCSIEGPIDSSC